MESSVEKIAETVLYEGYLLFPYRRSAIKNQQRWTFGGVYPRRYSEANGGHDPWRMQTQCLVVGDAGTTLQVKVRFLHVADRLVARAANASAGQTREFVEELRVGEQVHRPWEEAIERECIIADALCLGELLAQPRQVALEIPAGRADEPLVDPAGTVVGALVRKWRSLRGAVEITAELLQQDGAPATNLSHLFRLTVGIANTTPWPNEESAGPDRADAVRQTFVSTHTILRVQGGEFVSLLEPPDEYQEAAAVCANVKTWPVLVGEPGERHTLLSSPIILYDYPRVSPESPGDLYDATEIDELLRLSIMTLTDEEKQEMRESDARGREILERTESLAPEQLMKLHGAVRSLQPARKEER